MRSRQQGPINITIKIIKIVAILEFGLQAPVNDPSIFPLVIVILFLITFYLEKIDVGDF